MHQAAAFVSLDHLWLTCRIMLEIPCDWGWNGEKLVNKTVEHPWYIATTIAQTSTRYDVLSVVAQCHWTVVQCPMTQIKIQKCCQHFTDWNMVVYSSYTFNRKYNNWHQRCNLWHIWGQTQSLLAFSNVYVIFLCHFYWFTIPWWASNSTDNSFPFHMMHHPGNHSIANNCENNAYFSSLLWQRQCNLTWTAILLSLAPTFPLSLLYHIQESAWR